ncbi:MAG TPA: ABC transporter permease [Candidatus Acidoferrum sp.]|jgi:putative ABC transport system permease protein|nr:ABC transporter permease [Candidatus Acidoferrum sp.]
MNLQQLLRYTFRQFRQSPGFFLIAIAALALGIGANTAIFSAVEGLLLRPLPYGDPSHLVIVWEDASFIGFTHNTPAPANFVDWRAQNHVFTDMAALRYQSASLTGDQAPEQVLGGAVTPNFFDVLQVQPFLGRAWTREEDAAQSRSVVIGYNLWQRRFGGDRNIAGRSILMNGQGTVVLGVMPKGFFFPMREMDYWIPGYFTPERLAERDSHYLTVVARLKSEVTMQRAQEEMNVIAQRLTKQYPNSNTNIGAVVVPIQQEYAGDTRVGLWVLQIASAFVLLIACSNVANLLLARASGRRREIAVRVALGASAKQIITQLLSESLLLSCAGGVLGLWLGYVLWRILRRLIPEQIGGTSLSLNGKVLFFTAAISLVSGAFFGLFPALKAIRVSLHDALKEGSRAGESKAGIRLRDALVIGQFALALALLVGAGLMIQTLWNLRQVSLGFRSDHLLVSVLPLPRPRYDTEAKIRRFYRDVLADLSTKPGIVSAGFASDAPFTSEGDTEGYAVEGEPSDPAKVNDALYREVTPGYLHSVGARLLGGRFLGESDVEKSQPVVVVNEFLAKRHWPGQSAVGKHLRIGGPHAPWREVVGVVADVRERGLLLGMKPAVYLSTEQVQRPGADYLVVRTKQDPLDAVNIVRTAVWSVDSQQPVARVRSMDDIIENNVADRKRPMVLLAIFAGLALVLACFGVYGVLAYAVAQRTREIGVRMALGARPLDVTRMVVTRGLQLGLLGQAAGAGLAFVLGRLLETLLYGVRPVAAGVYATTAAALLIVALLACVIPARRAAQVDPVVALRYE